MNADVPARQHFNVLTQAEISEAIAHMAREGLSDHTIAAACRLAVEEVRRVLAERRESHR